MMSDHRSTRYFLLQLVALAACASPQTRTPQRFEFVERHMGGLVRIVLYAPDDATALDAAHVGFAQVAAVDASMSDYDPTSELSRLHQGPQTVSPRLFEVLKAARHFAELSDGAFDPTVGPVVRLWREARKTGKLPQVKDALNAVGYQSLTLQDPDIVRLEKPDMKLDLGGIAKGYACDVALKAMAAFHVRSVLVEAGGDMALGEPPPGQKGWHIRLPDDRVIPLAHCGIGTSGDSERFVEIDGRRYSHVVNPRTGMGLERIVTVTVIASDGTSADALATAISVLGPDRGLKLAAQVLIRWREGQTIRSASTPGFP